MFAYGNVHMHTVQVSEESRERVSDSLELELQVALSCSTWVLWTGFKSSVRAVSALNRSPSQSQKHVSCLVFLKTHSVVFLPEHHWILSSRKPKMSCQPLPWLFHCSEGNSENVLSEARCSAHMYQLFISNFRQIFISPLCKVFFFFFLGQICPSVVLWLYQAWGSHSIIIMITNICVGLYRISNFFL